MAAVMGWMKFGGFGDARDCNPVGVVSVLMGGKDGCARLSGCREEELGSFSGVRIKMAGRRGKSRIIVGVH